MTRRWLFAGLILFSICAFAKVQTKFFSILDFHGGVDSNYSSLTIKDNEVQDCRNVYFTKDNAVRKRQGYTLFGSTGAYPVLNIWQFTDTGGQSWQIIRISSGIYASPGTGIFTVRIATLSPTVGLVSEVNAQNKAVFVDRDDGVMTWDGTTTTRIAHSPQGNVICEFHNRVWVSGVANPNQNVLYGCRYGDVTDWVAAQLTVSDPVALPIGLNDNADGINTLFSGLNDVLYVFKSLSINGLYGFDQSDFVSRVITRDAGCVDPQSLQPYRGGLVFLSRRGLESFDGVTSNRISNKVKDRIDPCITNTIGNFTTRSWTQTTGVDFASGFIDTGLSTSVVDGSLTNRTTDFLQNSQSAWSSGTYGLPGSLNASTQIRYYDYTTNPGVLQTTFPDEFATIRSYVWSDESNALLGASVVSSGGMAVFTTAIGGDTPGAALRSTDPSSSVGFVEDPLKGTTFYVRIDHLTNPTTGPYFEMVISSQIVLGGADPCPPTTNYFKVRMRSGDTGKMTLDRVEYRNNSGAAATTNLGSGNLWIQPPLDLFMYISTSNYAITVLSTNTPSSGVVNGSHSWGATGCGIYLVQRDTETAPSFPNRNTWIDKFGVSPQRIIYTSSPTFDTGITSPIWDTFQASIATNSSLGTISFFSEVASSVGGPFDSFVSASIGSVLSSSSKRYLSIKALFSDYLSSSAISITNIDQAAYSTGTYRSAINSDTSLSAWGQFLANKVDSGGTHSFFIRAASGTFSVSSTTPAWTAITPGSIPSISTNPFFQIRDDFSTTNGRASPMQLQDFTVQWNDGQVRPNVASAVYDNRYWLSCTTTTGGTGNDLTIILSRNEFENSDFTPVFSYFDIRAASFGLYQNNLYHGDSASTGNVYLDNQGYNDNGVAINAYIKTKDYALEGTMFDKDFDSLYLTSDALGSYTINTSYNLDRSTSSYSLDSVLQNEMPGFISMSLPFGRGGSSPSLGRTINFTFQNNGLDQQMNLYGGILNYRLKGEIRNLGR